MPTYFAPWWRTMPTNAMNRDDYIPGRPSLYTGRAADDDAEHCAAARRWGSEVPFQTMADREKACRVWQADEHWVPFEGRDFDEFVSVLHEEGLL